ncbi:unannotated protein [freshwater metagenome]|uniref:Unannotated protein n=1 Tax=freshwater metagenome TaxID=449393 RepID=A0A6J5ZQP0_9ZZZZ
MPTTVLRSTPRSAASLRTSGVAYASLLLKVEYSSMVMVGALGSAGAVSTGALTTGALTTGAVTGGAGAAGATVVAEVPIIPSWPPTAATPSSPTVISRSVPATGDGISVSTLSVETSRIGSSTATKSPTALSQRVTVPSVTLSPSAGKRTGVPVPTCELDAGAEGAGLVDAGAATTTSGTTMGVSTMGASTIGAAITLGIGVWLGAVPASPITANAPPTSTTASSPATISRSTPETGEGISVSTLSVDTSSNGSSASTVSPTDLSQRVTVPSVTLSPSCGIETVVDTVISLVT